MRTIYVSAGDALGLNRCVATIGFFDGVHTGHRYLISRLKEIASREQLETCVVTFESHPRQVVQSGFKPQLLTTLEEKIGFLSELNVDTCAVLRFDKAMASMDAETFMREILSRCLNVGHLLIGYDNRFGHDCTEGVESYIRYGKKLNINVSSCEEAATGGRSVSSSVIRSLIKEGQVEEAMPFLGHYYEVSGIVVSGMHQGRLMGFPTANMEEYGDYKLLPANGVYVVEAWVEGKQNAYKAIMNIGTRPTFHGERVTLETHLLNLDEDIYGRRIKVRFLHRLRAERRFRDMEALVHQLREDKSAALKWFDNYKTKS